MSDRTEALPEAALASDQRWQLVQRVVSSHTFSGSPPLQEFLLYVAEHTLRGQAGEIKEQAIGSDVLRRASDFDPASDNIVRVRARQLRQKLEQFFQSEGRSEELIVTIPKGGYVPLFQPRPQQPAAIPEFSQPISPKRRIPAALPWSLVCMLAAACLVLAFGVPRQKIGNHNLSAESRMLWTQVFGKGQNTLVVLSDPGFGLWQALNHKDVNLQEYLRPQYILGANSGERDLAGLLAGNTISLSAAHFLTSAIPITEELDAALRVRPARQIDINDFKAGNVILFGSRRSNPWAELFEPRLHYLAVHPDGARSFFKERITGDTFQPSAAATDSYAVIALLPTSQTRGKCCSSRA